MSSLNLFDLIELYARRGVDDWAKAPPNLQSRAATCFMATQIATSYQDAADTLSTIYNGTNANKLSFIPMPKPGKSQKIDRCFFLPIRQKTASGEKMYFELVLLVSGTDCLAFRFEPADRPTWRHGYGHIQMNKKMLKKTINIGGIPQFIPDSYPAFPISTSSPLRMFFAMGTAVHGYADRGFAHLLVDVFQTAGRTSDSKPYLAELALFLGGTIRHRVDPGWKGLKVLASDFRHWGIRTISKKRR